MKATIWHNPACGTSRKTLAILQETSGVEVEVVEYLKTPPTAQKAGAALPRCRDHAAARLADPRHRCGRARLARGRRCDRADGDGGHARA